MLVWYEIVLSARFTPHKSAVIRGDFETHSIVTKLLLWKNMLLVLAMTNIESICKELRLWETGILGNSTWRDT